MTPTLDFNEGQDLGVTQGIGVGCGTTAQSMNVVVSNAGPDNAHITGLTLGLGGNSPYTLLAGAPPITVPAGSQVNVAIQPNEVPPDAVAGSLLNDILVVTTDAAGDAPHVVQLEETAAGVSLWASTTFVGFNPTVARQSSQGSFLIGNTGNVDAQVQLVAGDTMEFLFDGNQPVTSGQTTTVNATFNPQNPGKITTSLAISLQNFGPDAAPVCGTGSLELSLSGTAVSSLPVEASPFDQPMEIGSVSCVALGEGPPMNPAEVVPGVFNDSNAPVDYTLDLTGNWPSLFSPASTGGTIAANSPLQASITPISPSSTTGLSAGDLAFGVYAVLVTNVGSGASAVPYYQTIYVTTQGAAPYWAQNPISVYHGSSTQLALDDFGSGAPYNLQASGMLFQAQPSSGSASRNDPFQFSIDDTGTGPASTTVAIENVVGPVCAPIPGSLEVVGL